MKSIFSLFLFLCIAIGSSAAEIDRNVPDLRGEWEEVANYPDYGVLKIVQDGDKIEGRYVSVGSAQSMYFGFEVGELVLRGVIKGDRIEGEVLLKQHINLIRKCPEITTKMWSKADFVINENIDRLSGSWVQQITDYTTCGFMGQSPMEYVLEKVRQK